MPISKQQLLHILPNAGQSAGVFVPALNTAMVRYQIVGTLRQAAFIAQVGHKAVSSVMCANWEANST